VPPHLSIRSHRSCALAAVFALNAVAVVFWLVASPQAALSGSITTVGPTVTLCPVATQAWIAVDPVTSPSTTLTQTVSMFFGDGEVVTVTAESGVFTASWPFDVDVHLLQNTTHHLQVAGWVPLDSRDGCWYGGYGISTRTDRFGNPLTIVQVSERVHFPWVPSISGTAVPVRAQATAIHADRP
jgi:hypothetical protein